MKKSENLYRASAVIGGIKFDIFSSRKGIQKILMNKKASELDTKNTTKLHPDDPFMFNVFGQLKEYFDLQRKKFYVSLDIEGTEFQKESLE